MKIHFKTWMHQHYKISVINNSHHTSQILKALKMNLKMKVLNGTDIECLSKGSIGAALLWKVVEL